MSKLAIVGGGGRKSANEAWNATVKAYVDLQDNNDVYMARHVSGCQGGLPLSYSVAPACSKFSMI